MKAPSSANPCGPRILVCNDERHITRLLQVNLERHGYPVDCAYDGEEAVSLLEASGMLEGVRAFDKVLLDLRMPKLDGFEVLKWIRTHDLNPPIWVAMMGLQVGDRERIEQSGYHADSYWPDRFNPRDLMR